MQTWKVGYAWSAGILIAISTIQTEGALPDLIINSNALSPEIVYRTFSASSCDVVEGCITAGTHKLLIFDTETWNIGSGDLFIGNPANNPLFEYSGCHGHYHFSGFALYNLLDTSRNVVVSGHKTAFCLMDTYRFRTGANNNRVYACDYQGIQAGWADVYDRTLSCQWVDITDVPPGNYMLQVIVNPDNLFMEATTNNNVSYRAVTIPGTCAAPGNDNFANATLLPAIPYSVMGYNQCGTKEFGEPDIEGAFGGNSVWFRWTAPESGTVQITTAGSDFDTLLGVYTGGAVNGLTLVAANDDIIPGTVRYSSVTFTAVGGTTYRITVDGYNWAVGRFQLNLDPPANDAFANCQPLTGSAGTFSGYNIGATKENGEPAHAGNPGGHSVWYCWTAEVSGPQSFDTIGSDFDTTLAVYTGASVNQMSLVRSDDNSGGGLVSRVTFDAVAGTTYHIAVDGFMVTNTYAGLTGFLVLNWSGNNPSQLAIARVTGGRRVTVTGPPGPYVLQYSTDLTAWQTLTTFSISGTSYQYTHSSTLKSCFYRAVSPPP